MIGGFLLSIPWNYKAVTATYQEIDSKVYENKLISTAEEIEGYDYIIFIQDKRKANNLVDNSWGDFLNFYSRKQVRTIEESALEGFQVPSENTCIIVPISLGIEIEIPKNIDCHCINYRL